MCLLHGQSDAQKSSLLILGDLHYDLLQDHDMDWLSDRPGDLRQVEAYTAYTEEHWSDFMTRLKRKIEQDSIPVKAIVQLGDLSEGLAGTKEKAFQMASHTMKAIDAVQMPVPWILTKGNHDVTGPGAAEAFQEYYVPMIREQSGNPEIYSASYSFRCGKVQVTCLDPWDRETDMIAFLEEELSGSDAKFKFVAIHEPVIPVTERCWHTLRRNPEQRENLMEVIARNKAIVLCGHLHRYSVVSRSTPYGQIVQVMVISVVKDRKYKKPSYLITEYGPSLVEDMPDWQPETMEARKEILAEEAKYVSFYKQTDLPGYAIIKVDGEKESIQLEYYAAFGNKPYDKIDLIKLLNQ
ncbi:MAG: metallophosphoesterase [Bacteroidales bacterium]|nr:metallophosphoesterase [Bacteroidales bacterium]